MRPRYHTESIVLGRTARAEASATLYLLTRDFGLVAARVQGIRNGNAKLASSLQTLSQSDIILVRGKDAWRLSGARLTKNWFQTLSTEARHRVGRCTALLLRLIRGETREPELFDECAAFFEALTHLCEEEADAAESIAVLRFLRILGLDAGDIPGEFGSYDQAVLQEVKEKRHALILRINHGIRASQL